MPSVTKRYVSQGHAIEIGIAISVLGRTNPSTIGEVASSVSQLVHSESHIETGIAMGTPRFATVGRLWNVKL